MNSIIWRAEGSFQWRGNNSDCRTASYYQQGLDITKYRFLTANSVLYSVLQSVIVLYSECI